MYIHLVFSLAPLLFKRQALLFFLTVFSVISTRYSLPPVNLTSYISLVKNATISIVTMTVAGLNSGLMSLLSCISFSTNAHILFLKQLDNNT